MLYETLFAIDYCLMKLWLLTGHLLCKKDEFSCSRSRRCIPARFLCNGVDDCSDGSDEASCLNCTAGFFSCGPSDICLPRHKLCDGRMDCKDGRDEIQEMCGSAQPHPQTSSGCPASQFQCRDGTCISHSWRCDNSADCSDGSDEDNCGEWWTRLHITETEICIIIADTKENVVFIFFSPDMFYSCND